MAKVITLDALTALISAEPEKVTRERSITKERQANLDAVIADATVIRDVTVERKGDGTELKPETVKAAYAKLIKEQELSETVSVRKFANGTVVVGSTSVLFPTAE
jgi:hypothetical protein